MCVLDGSIATDSALQAGSLVLVSNRESSIECAIFVLARTEAGPTIKLILPIYAAILVKPSVVEGSDDRVLHIVGTQYLVPDDLADALEFYCAPGASFDKFVDVTNAAITNAVREEFKYGGTSHEWLLQYAKKQPTETKEDELDGFLVRSAGAMGMQSFKDEWINMMLKDKELEYTTLQPIRVCVGTYNVNGKAPKDVAGVVTDLKPWLAFPADSLPDIYAIGFQELDLSAEAFVFNDSNKEEDWCKAIELSLALGDYVKLRSKQLVAMVLIVYARRTIIPHIKEIYSDAQGTGILGVMGNKGGVSIRFKVFDSTICFVNSHLAAHDNAVIRRNLDHQEICRRVMFTDRQARHFTIFDHDHLIWLGDLNYRIPLPDAEVKQLARNGPFTKLLEFDQLGKQMRDKAAFTDFQEMAITFPPTYKYDPGTDEFDTSEKQRTPAYCDRILYLKNKEDPKISQVEYTSHPLLRISDHKPVRALFNIKARVCDRAKEREVFYGIVRQLDSIENKAMPVVNLSCIQFNFENVEYLKRQSQTLVVENVGQVPAKFSFIPKLDDTIVCKPWMEIQPMHSGLLRPGESQIVTISILVGDEDVAVLNAAKDVIDDILILHLENGKDSFLVVSGSFKKTCFGVKLQDSLPPPKPPISILEGDMTPLIVSTEIWILTHYLFNHGLSEENLFFTPGDTVQMEEIRARLDSKQLLLPGTDVHSVAETYIQFLKSLPDPVIPFNMYQRCNACSNSAILCRQLVSDLNAAHYDLFMYIVLFLKETLSHRTMNRLTSDRLALLFGSVMIRQETRSNAAQAPSDAVSRRKAEFLMHFIDPGVKLTPASHGSVTTGGFTAYSDTRASSARSSSANIAASIFQKSTNAPQKPPPPQRPARPPPPKI